MLRKQPIKIKKKKNRNNLTKDIQMTNKQMKPSVHCSIIYGSRNMETNKVPFDR